VVQEEEQEEVRHIIIKNFIYLAFILIFSRIRKILSKSLFLIKNIINEKKHSYWNLFENKIVEQILKSNENTCNQKLSNKIYEKIIDNNKIIKTKVHNYDSIYFSKNLGSNWHIAAIVIRKCANYINLITKQKLSFYDFSGTVERNL